MDNSKDALEQQLRKFLESTPPNVSVCMGVRPFAPKILHLHCDVDDGVRRFDSSSPNSLGYGFRFLEYVCKDCGEFEKTYALLIELRKRDGDDPIAEIMKLGEFPPFGAPISARIQDLLDKDDLELYRKGSRSEAHGLGIGAATYFRRIVDSQWKRLVTELRRAAEKLGYADLAVFDKALQETQFSTAVKMLKDAIPDKLLILSGKNPLTLLYSPLSVPASQAGGWGVLAAGGGHPNRANGPLGKHRWRLEGSGRAEERGEPP